MYIIQNLHWFALFIGALVFVHELGHFLVAKACRVKVLRFSIGFGPKLFGFTRGETEYWVSALPLGGYVKMLGEVPGATIPPEDAARAFSNRPVWQRGLVALAGPTFNFVLALVIYFAIGLGTHTFRDTRLGIVSVGDPAWEAGLRPGDKIVAIDEVPVDEWGDLREMISTRPGETLAVAFERAGERQVVDIVPIPHNEANLFREIETRGRVGISPNFVKPILGIVDALSPAAIAGVKTGDVIERVNGERVTAWHEVRTAAARTAKESPLRIAIVRGEEKLEIEIVPTAFPPGLDVDLFSAADAPGGYTGLVTKESLVVKLEPETPAAGIGLEIGDRLVRLEIEKDGTYVVRPIGVWSIDLAAFQGVDATSNFTLAYQRGAEIFSKPLKLIEREEKDEFKNVYKRHVFGAFNDVQTLDTYTYERDVGAAEAFVVALGQVGLAATLIGKGLAKIARGDIPFDSVGGPIMLFVLAERSAKRGIEDFLAMLALISVNLGLLNLLPIPILDGGHLLLFAVEAIRRRPPSLRFREVANIVGMTLLLLLMVLVFRNDIMRFVLG
ncbi:MAG: site-2 protease family protein [Myxococcota bacterium]